MMEVQLLEGLTMPGEGGWGLALNGSERKENSREPTPSQRQLQHPGESRNLNPILRNLGLSQTICSLKQTVQTWGKRCGLQLLVSSVFPQCPRMLQNETLQKKGKWKKEEEWSTLKMHWIFQQNKDGATWEEQKYPKGASKTMSGDQYRLGFKTANMLRRVGADPWLERTRSTKHCVLKKKLKYFLKERLFLCFLERRKLKPWQDFAPGRSALANRCY